MPTRAPNKEEEMKMDDAAGDDPEETEAQERDRAKNSFASEAAGKGPSARKPQGSPEPKRSGSTRPARQVEPTQPSRNSRRGNAAMRAVHEHVIRQTPEGVPMETETHYQTLIPRDARVIATYTRKRGYRIVEDHDLNSDVEVVVEIPKEVKDGRYKKGVKTIRQFQNEGVLDERVEGVEQTEASGTKEKLRDVLSRMDGDEEDETDGGDPDGDEGDPDDDEFQDG